MKALRSRDGQHLRRALAALGVLALGCGVLFAWTAPRVLAASTVTISGSMEGNLPVNPGDTLRAGYDFTMPGSHPAATLTVSGAAVVLTVQCPGGSSYVLTIAMPDQTFSVPANSSDWFPSGDQQSPLVYQGSVPVPSSSCAGGHAPSGATFTANFASTDTTDPVHVRFHYADNTAGSWSGTASTVPGPPSSPPATLWLQKLDSCAETLSGAQFELVASGGSVVSGPSTSASGRIHAFPHPSGCPAQGGSCTVTGTGCLTLTVPVPSSGTSMFQIVETVVPAGHVNCIKGDSRCTNQVGTVVVAADGSLQVTFTASLTSGRTLALPASDPNTGNAFWLGTQTDPGLYYNGTPKQK